MVLCAQQWLHEGVFLGINVSVSNNLVSNELPIVIGAGSWSTNEVVPAGTVTG
jgi:hypothetical protein